MLFPFGYLAERVETLLLEFVDDLPGLFLFFLLVSVQVVDHVGQQLQFYVFQVFQLVLDSVKVHVLLSLVVNLVQRVLDLVADLAADEVALVAQVLQLDLVLLSLPLDHLLGVLRRIAGRFGALTEHLWVLDLVDESDIVLNIFLDCWLASRMRLCGQLGLLSSELLQLADFEFGLVDEQLLCHLVG